MLDCGWENTYLITAWKVQSCRLGVILRKEISIKFAMFDLLFWIVLLSFFNLAIWLWKRRLI